MTQSTPPSPQPLPRDWRFRLARVALWTLILLQPLAVLAVWIAPNALGIVGFEVDWTYGDIRTYSAVQTALGLTYNLLIVAPYLVIYWHMLRLLGHFAAYPGLRWSMTAPLRAITRALVLAAIFSLITPSVASLIGTLHNDVGERLLVITLSSRSLVLLTLALFAGLFVRVAEAAAVGAEELDEIV